ncbi:tRNA uridine-5-carboxymethylaminomethyl(34) synthesis GTPase MnmE [Finegoldia sp. BIOML-A2]|uniref:tRNA uridine-5-carboxymethylaminomethyl(34) synthesis GTPase MnmE n=1 Tax=unclassified Finegoldia TaxID=2619637 RepID=UPI0012AFD611|nr:MULTISPECIES: tRNA uridine-5-carboxymethylaminomethyl(34) synthesis GTPase MnmE [unclassified Finegoldia]MSA97334.1 tRNA uridine-5-carboxymethylaminomethyl(34) synthesis GTPase MnmE [Finegoldia sp. BIOML-A5]MSB00660.1 tRNA uridine-5-carboxymethylaminomethyl(34) synthesis GTPase MnmE [Finegoldia sp. BIOML-A2]MSB11172.1 tRNA uridine-5-carboxymethylaminomethyl(34) synthesis GTPase MnmE [Finegoldia sp. BIOML-A1]
MDDCIAAISSATGEAGIGIVRMTGEGCVDVLDSVFKRANDNADLINRKMTYGHIVDDNEIVDEVLVCYMKAPHTYTREDVVEIYTHGGVVAVRKVLEVLLNNGARLAEAGEFTKRAFLNGRIDLSQAEAIIDMIKAKTDKAYSVSMKQLEGSVNRNIKQLRDKLLDMLSHVEYSINFTEDMQDELDNTPVLNEGKEVLDKLKKLSESANRGRIIRDGINTTIIGKPNVGKSSLLNALLKENRAIVTDIPGTTRDVIEEYIDLDGISLKINDTAGIRDTEDIVEKIGVEKSVSFISDSDLIIAIFDSSREFDDEDRKILDLIRDKKSIVLLNKIDLDGGFDFDENLEGIEVIHTSIKNNEGIEDLENKIIEMFNDGYIEANNDNIITNIRHRDIINKAIKSLESSLHDMEAGVPIDCFEVDLRNAWEILGEITGETVDDDVLNKIFSDFCIGK